MIRFNSNNMEFELFPLNGPKGLKYIYINNHPGGLNGRSCDYP